MSEKHHSNYQRKLLRAESTNMHKPNEQDKCLIFYLFDKALLDGQITLAISDGKTTSSTN